MTDKPAMIIGGFYEMPDGRVAKTFGWNGDTGQVSYHFDDDAGPLAAAEAEVSRDWRPRPDLADFPMARDPVLPYVFDLFWDAKTRSSLAALLADPKISVEVREAMEAHGLEPNDVEREALETLEDEASGPTP